MRVLSTLPAVGVVCLLACAGGDPTAVPPPPVSLEGQIIFSSDRDGVLDLWLVGADGSPPRRFALAEQWSRFEPRLSFDCTHVAYLSQGKNRNGLYVMNNLVGDDHAITTDSTDSEPAWSPDGTELAFSSQRDSTISSIFVVNADGTGLKRLTPTTQVAFSPAWSPDGHHIAFVSTASQPYTPLTPLDVYEMNPDGSGVTQLTTTGKAVQYRLSWSPDGGSLLYTASPDPLADRNGTNLYRLDMATLASTPLTDRPGQNRSGSWSPDGTRIALTTDRDTTGLSIWVMNADGSGEVNYSRLHFVSGDDNPDWCRLP